jgi:hypothetical protein
VHLLYPTNCVKIKIEINYEVGEQFIFGLN